MFKTIGLAVIASAICIVFLTEPAEAQIFRRRPSIFRPSVVVSAPVCNTPVCNTPINVVHDAIIDAIIAPVAIPVPVPVAVFQYLPAIGSQPQIAQPVITTPVNYNSPESIDGPPALIVEDDAPEAPPVTQQDWVSAMRTNCASCHNVTKKSGGVVLFNRSNQFEPNVTIDKINEVIASGSMPKNRAISPQLRVLLIKGATK